MNSALPRATRRNWRILAVCALIRRGVMMDRALVRAKAIGLRGTVDVYLQDPASIQFDPAIALEWFERFAPLLRLLHESGEEFADLPRRPSPLVTRDAFQGRGHIDRAEVKRLCADLTYCVDILTILPTVEGQRSGDAWGVYDPADKADGVDLSKKDAFLRDLRLAVQTATKGAPFALIMSDIDHFKQVNDEFGHQAGDRVLAVVAQLIRQTAGRRGRAYRFGGEEFAILLPHFNEGEAAAVADRVRLECRALSFGANMPPSITLTLGVADSYGGEDPDVIVKRADDALYRGKKDGRDRVACHRWQAPAHAIKVTAHAAETTPRKTRPVVMVIDGDKFIRDFLGDFLGMDGFTTIKAETVFEAIAVPGLPPQVALVSLELKEFTGVRVLDLMKKRYPTTPLIAMTGMLNRDIAIGAAETGATLLEKPFKIENVIAKCLLACGQEPMGWQSR